MKCDKTNCGSNVKGECTQKDKKVEKNNKNCFWTVE